MKIGRLGKSTPIVEARLVVSPSAAFGEIAAIEWSVRFGAWSASNSIRGMSPSELCSRSWLNQATHSTVASSSWT